MILALSGPRFPRSAYPFAPLSGHGIPARLRMASIDYAVDVSTGADSAQSIRVMSDLEQRVEQDHDHLTERALTYAGALGEIDALHIEWGLTDRDDFDQLVFWERLGRILRKAGV